MTWLLLRWQEQQEQRADRERPSPRAAGACGCGSRSGIAPPACSAQQLLDRHRWRYRRHSLPTDRMLKTTSQTPQEKSQTEWKSAAKSKGESWVPNEFNRVATASTRMRSDFSKHSLAPGQNSTKQVGERVKYSVSLWKYTPIPGR